MLLKDKKILITGIASERSIAWGVAQAAHREGAQLAFTFQGEKLEGRVRKLADQLGSNIVLPLDVAEDADIQNVADSVRQEWGELDGLLHSIGFAPREALSGGYLESVSRENYRIAHDISAYSFAALGQACRPLMQDRKAAMLTLSYIGAVRAVAGYNVMGPAKASLEANVRFMAADLGPENIRVNGISAGPIKTLAAAGIKGFRSMLDSAAAATPLQRNVSQEEVGNAAAFLLSDYASAITGEIIYADAGYHIMGMQG